MKKTRKSINNLLDYSNLEHVLIHNEVYTICEGYGHLAQAINIESTIREVIESQEDLFEIKSDLRTGRPSIVSGRLGRDLLQVINSYPDIIYHTYPCHRLSPYIDLWINVTPGPTLAHSMTDLELIGFYNGFVKLLREYGRHPSFVRDVENRERASRKDIASARAYTKRMLQDYASLAVIGLELRFGRSTPETWGKDVVEPAHLKRSVARFMEDIKSKVPGYAGFVRRIVRSREKSYHAQVLLFFDGTLNADDIALGWRLGGVWVQRTTKGQGCYTNLNAHKPFVAKLGLPSLGVMRGGDPEQRANLEAMVQAFVGMDRYARLNVSAISRTFTKGVARRRGTPLSRFC